jgi:hypothetical protein
MRVGPRAEAKAEVETAERDATGNGDMRRGMGKRDRVSGI